MRLKQNTDEEELAKLCLESYKLMVNDSINIIDLCDDLNKTIREELIYIEDNEPLKLFKTAHKEWEEYKNILTNLYEKNTNGVRQEFKDFEEII